MSATSPAILQHIDLRVGGMMCAHCPLAIAELPTGQTVAVEFLPKQPGEFGFACPMGMFRGRLIVK